MFRMLPYLMMPLHAGPMRASAEVVDRATEEITQERKEPEPSYLRLVVDNTRDS